MVAVLWMSPQLGAYKYPLQRLIGRNSYHTHHAALPHLDDLVLLCTLTARPWVMYV